MPDQQLHRPPSYCECAAGPCDQTFEGVKPFSGTFLYPSEPAQIADVIERSVDKLRRRRSDLNWRTWRDFKTAGQVIFCEICKSLRFTDMVFADVTTLNFNLLFEIGFAIGLGKPVAPVRDTTFVRDQKEFEELGVLDVVGYIDFQNSDQLVSGVLDALPISPLGSVTTAIDAEQPIYVMKGHIDTEGELRLMSILKKSPMRFRTYDVVETPRLSLHEARRQISASHAVVAHLLSEERRGAVVHNARCALVAGLATATGKITLLLQEGDKRQPIDYRDLVSPYVHAGHLDRHFEPLVRKVWERITATDSAVDQTPARLLERLDLGDVAAENEIQGLRQYFVRTGQYFEAKRGNARLVTGRKGSGKTAIFYAVRGSIPNTHAFLTLDLKPEGFQFAKLREAVLDRLTPGLQEHTLTALWEYILLCELCQKITDQDYTWAYRDPERRERFEQVRQVYSVQPAADVGDFSERLLRQINAVADRFPEDTSELAETGQLTEILFQDEIRDLKEALEPYLKEKEEIWILVDNLDKGWPTLGSRKVDILVLRTLLDAGRKLQQQLERQDLAFKIIICLRNDIYDHLVRQTPDRGKDRAIDLDWDDPETFKELIRQRLIASGDLEGDFDQVWNKVLPAHVGVRETFGYLLDRTLMRPRDLLQFFHRIIETAINRGHLKVTEDDIKTAEASYSKDFLLSMAYELRDIYPEYTDLLYCFLGQPAKLGWEDAQNLLVEEAEVPGSKLDDVIQHLLWFGFFGVLEDTATEPVYSHEVRYDVQRLLSPLRREKASLHIHPAFHEALLLER